MPIRKAVLDWDPVPGVKNYTMQCNQRKKIIRGTAIKVQDLISRPGAYTCRVVGLSNEIRIVVRKKTVTRVG